MKTYEFDAPLREIPEKGGAYIVFPYDVRVEFGTGRRRVHASFDGIPYDGSLVNMGLKNPDGSWGPQGHPERPPKEGERHPARCDSGCAGNSRTQIKAHR